MSRRAAAATLLLATLVAGCSSGLPPGPDAAGDPFSAASTGATTSSSAGSADTGGQTASSSAATSPGPTASHPSASAPVVSATATGAVPAPSASPLTPPKLPSVPGYTFAAAPAAVVAAFKPLAATYAGTLSTPTVRSVVRGKVTVCSQAVMRLNPAFVGKPMAEDKLITGLVQGLGGKGYTLRNKSVSGQSVVVAYSRSATVIAWYRGGTVVMLVSTQPADVPLDFAAAYVKRT